MVRVTLKNISSWVGNETTNSSFVTYVSEKCKTDLSFNKFLSLVLKHSILIFEKNLESLWAFKSEPIILNQIDKCISISYNDYIINITKIQIENDANDINEIKQQLDKFHLGLKKKLTDLFELKNLLTQINLEPPKVIESINQINQINQINKNQINPKKKKIINNDIYIEEFSN